MVQLADEFFFFAATVMVAYSVETWRVGHFAEMGEFVAHDVVPEFNRQEQAHITDVNIAA